MTHEEITDLLETILNAYPNVMKNITNPEAMIRAWEMAFGNDEAEKIYKAARYHMDHSKFFPTIADIRESIRMGEIVYGMPPEAPRIAIESGYDNETGEFRCPCQICLIADSGQCNRTKAEYDVCWI